MGTAAGRAQGRGMGRGRAAGRASPASHLPLAEGAEGIGCRTPGLQRRVLGVSSGGLGQKRGVRAVPGERSPGRRSRCCVSGGVEGGSSGSCCPGGSNSRARVSVKNFIWCLGSVSHWPNVCPMTVPEPVAEQWTWSVASPWGAWSCRLSSSSGAGMVPARDAERMTP